MRGRGENATNRGRKDLTRPAESGSVDEKSLKAGAGRADERNNRPVGRKKKKLTPSHIALIPCLSSPTPPALFLGLSAVFPCRSSSAVSRSSFPVTSKEGPSRGSAAARAPFPRKKTRKRRERKFSPSLLLHEREFVEILTVFPCPQLILFRRRRFSARFKR